MLKRSYGTGCSQAVPHPSTILARRCLTSVIRRERVCSSWYGRRQHDVNVCPCLFVLNFFQVQYRVPQALPNHIQGRSKRAVEELQIKNIKLHIVTDIKVNFNSMLDFRISQFGWGVGYSILQRKLITLPSGALECFADASNCPIMCVIVVRS